MIMRKTKTLRDAIWLDKGTRIYILIELLIYLLFLFLDLFHIANDLSNVLKYCSIWLCLVFVLLRYRITKAKNVWYTFIILLFTVIADTFLVFNYYIELGILPFILVQILYSCKIKCICKENNRIYLYELLAISFIWCILVFAIIKKDMFDIVLALASLYFLLFSGNVFFVWVQVLKNKNVMDVEEKQSILGLAIGLMLFYLCDINVGLNYLSLMEIGRNGTVLSFFINLASFLMWFFYLPSQVILTLHGIWYKTR